MSDNAQYAFQANFKFGPQYKETLVNVPAATPDEMLGKLDWLTANAAKFVAAHEALHAASGLAPLAGNITKTEVQNDPPQHGGPASGGWNNQGQQAPSWSGQQQSSQAQAGGNNVVEDKWGNRWEYDLPDAPLTPRGPAVMKHAKSREGKPYAKWEDPAAGPRWFSERKPKVETADRWQGSFVNNR